MTSEKELRKLKWKIARLTLELDQEREYRNNVSAELEAYRRHRCKACKFFDAECCGVILSESQSKRGDRGICRRDSPIGVSVTYAEGAWTVVHNWETCRHWEGKA